jgi:hypothetical protein
LALRIQVRLKYSAWSSLVNNPLPAPNYHGNIGNNHRLKGSQLADCQEDLIDYLKEIEQQGEYHETRYIRKKTGIGIHDGELDQCDLPSTMTQMKLYVMFSRLLGHHDVDNAKGGFWKEAAFLQTV